MFVIAWLYTKKSSKEKAPSTPYSQNMHCGWTSLKTIWDFCWWTYCYRVLFYDGVPPAGLLNTSANDCHHTWGYIGLVLHSNKSIKITICWENNNQALLTVCWCCCGKLSLLDIQEALWVDINKRLGAKCSCVFLWHKSKTWPQALWIVLHWNHMTIRLWYSLVLLYYKLYILLPSYYYYLTTQFSLIVVTEKAAKPLSFNWWKKGLSGFLYTKTINTPCMSKVYKEQTGLIKNFQIFVN